MRESYRGSGQQEGRVKRVGKWLNLDHHDFSDGLLTLHQRRGSDGAALQSRLSWQRNGFRHRWSERTWEEFAILLRL